MTTREEVLGRTVYGSDGEELGRVSAVYDDRDTGKLEWLAIGRSLLGRKSVLVPVAAADIRETGVFVKLPSDKIDAAPEISAEEIGQEEERRLYEHYGIEYSERRSSSGLPQEQESHRRANSPQGRRRSSGRRSGGTRQRQTRQRRAETTREELYEEAQKLGIEGRSKMNKEQLKRAVGRRRGGAAGKGEMANPVEVQKFLEGVGYPTRKRELVTAAESQGANRRVRSALERLPERRSFESPAEVSEALGSRS
jgi:hypothetical protein